MDLPMNATNSTRSPKLAPWWYQPLGLFMLIIIIFCGCCCTMGTCIVHTFMGMCGGGGGYNDDYVD